MSIVEHELEDFSRFVRERIGVEPIATSLSELMDEWRVEHSSDEQFAEDVAALEAAIKDFKNGDRGRLASEVSKELRASLRMDQG